MFKNIIRSLCVLIVLFFPFPAMAANPTPNESKLALLQTFWDAQAIESLGEGIWVVPESVVNQYFSSCAEDTRVKNPTLTLLDNNKIDITFDSSIGRMCLACDVVRFVHNQNESYAELHVRKKKVNGRPFVSWMLKYISLGAINDLYGNPLKNEGQMDAKISGNAIKVNFRPLVDSLPLNNALGRKIEIESITTREGALELHTNIKINDLWSTVVKKLDFDENENQYVS